MAKKHSTNHNDRCPTCGAPHHLVRRWKRQRKLARARSRTPVQMAKRAWVHMRVRTGHRPGCPPPKCYEGIEIRMTKEEFMEWAVPRYEEWQRTHPNEIPSIDRVREEGHYELSNIQMISRWENTQKTRWYKNRHAPPGKAWCTYCKKYKPVELFYIVKKPKYPGQIYSPGCQPCTIEHSNKQRKRILAESAADPDKAEHYRQKRAEYKARYEAKRKEAAKDPEVAAAMRAKQLEYERRYNTRKKAGLVVPRKKKATAQGNP